MKVEQIKIKGLFGELNYDIKLEDNKLILVAENGSGKTTIVNIIYYFLSKQWNKLIRYKFNSISAKINGKTIEFNRDELTTLSSEKIKRLTRRLPIHLRQEMTHLLAQEDFSDIYDNPLKIEYFVEKYNLPRSYFYEMVEEFRIRQTSLFEELLPEKREILSELIDCQILYLPTFRRIEQELKAIFPDLESDVEKYDRKRRFTTRTPKDVGYVELVEFGMEDVKRKIKGKLNELEENLNYRIKNNLTGGYLKDVINRTYSKITYKQIQAINEKALKLILDRIDESVLSKSEKNKLLNFVKEINQQGSIEKEETKIIAYFIFRLSEIYNDLKKEEKDIEQFISICNEYSENKQFVYNNINFKITINPLRNGKPVNKEEIELRDLSSGEKQIVSLFSHLFLSQQKDFFIVIDEPELSLSVPWQQKILVDIVKNPYCKGLLSVTHSPFIFENELEKYAHGLSEFYF